MKYKYKKYLRTITRRFWGVTFSFIIFIAVFVQLAREAFPLLNDYRAEIAHWVSDQLNMDVSIAGIDASWRGLRPKVVLSDVVLNKDGNSVLKFSSAVAELSILESLLHGEFTWSHLQFSDIKTQLIQAENGSWSIDGIRFADSGENVSRFDDPMDLFLIARRVDIKNTQIELLFNSGKTVELVVPAIDLENDQQFLRMNSNITVDGEQETFSLTIEGHGNPRNSKTFDSIGYVKLNNFPMQKLLEVFFDKNAADLASENITESLVDLDFWFKGTPKKGLTFRGLFNSEFISVPIKDSAIYASEFEAYFSGKWQLDNGWQWNINQLRANVFNQQTINTTFSMFGRGLSLEKISVEEIDLAELTKFVLATKLSGSADNKRSVYSAFSYLNPTGHLRNIEIIPTDKDSGYFDLQANVKGVSVGAYLGAPEAENVSGFVRSSAKYGYIDLASDNGYMMHFPKIYQNPLRFDRAHGRISWEVQSDKKVVYVGSELLTLQSDETDELAHGYFHLILPFSREMGESEMTLSISLENTLATNHRKYVPKTAPDNLLEWLSTSIKSGRLTDAKFLFQGSVNTKPEVEPTLQFYGNVHDVELAFDKNWPALENVVGKIYLDNRDLQVDIKRADLLGNEVNYAAINLINNPNRDGLALSIKGGLSSNAAAAMDLLKNSPVNQLMGSTFDEWQVSGKVSAVAELVVPLDYGSDGMHQNIDIDFEQSKLTIPSLNLEFEEIEGELHYSNELGINTNNLRGKLWQQPYRIQIGTKTDGGVNNTSIQFSGNMKIKDLTEWTRRPEFKFLNGATDVNGELIIYGGNQNRDVQLLVESELLGVEVDLPAPFYKASAERMTVKSDFIFKENRQEYAIRLQDVGNIFIVNDVGKPSKTHIHMSENSDQIDRELIFNEGLFLTGEIPRIEFAAWQKVRDDYFEYQKLFAQGQQQPVEIGLNVLMKNLELGQAKFNDLIVKGAFRNSGWDLNVENYEIAGLIHLPVEDRPIEFDLDYIRLPTQDNMTEDEEERPSYFQDIVFNELSAINFSTNHIYLGDRDIGAWHFDMVPVDSGIYIDNLYGSVGGIDVGSEDLPASFVWARDGDNHISSFRGIISTRDIGKVLEEWDQERLMTSQSGTLIVEFEWPAPPDILKLDQFKGTLGLEVKNGSFIRGANADDTGFLRLLALFNFDTIARRLRLDFSDLASEGLAFDKIQGLAVFNSGKIYFHSPLVVESSSSQIQFAGTLDAVKEKVDAELVVTLPAAGNIAAATALAAGLPAAIGVYVVGKLFRKQINKVSSISYKVKGKWENPKLKVKKIFDAGAAKSKAKEVDAEEDVKEVKEIFKSDSEEN